MSGHTPWAELRAAVLADTGSKEAYDAARERLDALLASNQPPLYIETIIVTGTDPQELGMVP